MTINAIAGFMFNIHCNAFDFNLLRAFLTHK